MDLEEMLALEAKCYVAMSEIDYDLIRWHRRHYSPSKAMARGILHNQWSINRALNTMRRAARDANVATQGYRS